MNERIKELAKQAGWDPARPPYGKFSQYDEFDHVKFAQLIVQDCVGVCNKVYFDNYPDAEDFERSEEGEAIKQHFGVE